MIWVSCLLIVAAVCLSHEAGALKQRGLGSAGASVGAIGAVMLAVAFVLFGASAAQEGRNDCAAETLLTSAPNSDK